jgi:hypothetical protein
MNRPSIRRPLLDVPLIVTDKSRAKYSRRAILKQLGLGAAFLPLLSTERARAATATGYPVRFIAVTWTDGVCPPNFYATGAAGPLPATLPDTLQPLANWSSKLILFRSQNRQQSPIDLKCMIDNGQAYTGHASYPALLTGFIKVDGTKVSAAGPSIDQIFADNLATMGVTNAQLNVGCRPYSTYTSYRADGTPNVQQTDPYKLFTSLFAGTTTSGTPLSTLLPRRKSVLDLVGAELTSFATNLGTDDRAKVQIHLDSIRSLENQLAAMPTTSATCTAPTITPTGLNFKTITNYPDHVKFMSDLVAAAVICGKARSVTMDLIDNGGGNSLTFPWLNIPSPDFHAIAHQGSANYAQKSVIDKWFYQQSVAELVSQLAAAPEGNGTVLDNTVILVCNDMMEGANHSNGSIPYVLIGGGAGFFNTGRMVTLPNQVANNQLLTSILHAMGIGATSVGDPKYPGDLDSVLKA